MAKQKESFKKGSSISWKKIKIEIAFQIMEFLHVITIQKLTYGRAFSSFSSIVQPPPSPMEIFLPTPLIVAQRNSSLCFVSELKEEQNIVNFLIFFRIV